MKKTILTRLLALVSVLALLFAVCVVSISAAEQETGAEITEQVPEESETEEDLGGFFSPKRIEYAITVTVQGMLMIFAVLSILWGIVSLMKVFLHDIPEKRAAKKAVLAKAVAEVAEIAAPEVQPEIAAVPEEDEGEIVAAITAAIAVMLQSEEYKGQFESGFRVVSFSRKGGAWNKQN